jgi:hypothetical protein
MLLTTIALASLFWALTLATITLEDIPAELRAGSDYYIKWTQDRPATAEASFTPILPPSYPLAVRNPYLSGTVLQ